MARRIDLAEAYRAWYWFADAMRIQDWQVHIVISDDPPSWVGKDPLISGSVSRDGLSKSATVWLSPRRHGLYGLDLLETAFHEFLHVAFYDIGADRAGRWQHEGFLDRLAATMVIAYKPGYKAAAKKAHNGD